MMRLNPFSKKSSGGYYARIKAEFEPLERELNKARREAADAERARNDAQSYYNDLLAQHGGNWRVPVVEQAVRVLNEAKRHYEEVDYTARHLYDKVRPLREIVEAPAKYQDAQQALKELAQTDQRTRAERERLQAQIVKVEERLTQAQARQQAETVAASRQWADAEEGFEPPESLARAELEVRLAQASLTELKAALATVEDARKDLPSAWEEQTRALIRARQIVADIELREHLEPLMALVARATVSAHEVSFYNKRDQFIVEVPHAKVLEAAKALDVEIDALKAGE